MINPFQYSGVVGKDAFCNRKKELTDLVKAMENDERLFVYSARWISRTSRNELAGFDHGGGINLLSPLL